MVITVSYPKFYSLLYQQRITTNFKETNPFIGFNLCLAENENPPPNVNLFTPSKAQSAPATKQETGLNLLILITVCKCLNSMLVEEAL